MFTFAQKMCVFAWASVGLFAQSTPVASAPETRTSGMIGVTDGQAARVNVLNPGVPAPAIGVVCTATLNFVDGAGTLLKSGPVVVLPGQSQSLDVFGDKDLALTGATRREIRATITIPAVVPPVSTATSTPPAACTLIGTLEVFDETSGKTLVVLGVGHTVSSPSVTSTTANP
jgi:hypothetical protein